MEEISTQVIEKKDTSTSTLKINLTQLKEKTKVEKSQPEPLKVKQTSQKPNLQYQNLQSPKQDSKIVDKKQINFFGGSAQENEQILQRSQTEVVQEKENSSIISTPNYDLMQTLTPAQEKQIFKIDKKKEKKQPSPLLKKLRIITFALLFGVLGSWSIYNAVELSNVTAEYNLKLGQYLFKLESLDSASGLNDLFPTYPEEINEASSIAKQSNWFDRFCNFIAGIFGG